MLRRGDSEAMSYDLCPKPVDWHPAETWIDVGAHRGEKTLSAAQSNPALRVYAFEPNLHLALQLVGMAPNFIVLPMAVAEKNGAADFYLNSYETASSLLPMDPQGLERWIDGDLDVVRSAGNRLKDIQRIALEVQIALLPLHVGSSQKSTFCRVTA